tara:strand:- start:616 stop:1002 length:387 start_codon:yes stop_codon:yes gene_type:complete
MTIKFNPQFQEFARSDGQHCRYVTHNDDIEIDVNGTSLRGYLEVSYEDLVKKLGEPFVFDEYKTDAAWTVSWFDEDKATIYNWKNGKNYCGPEGLNVEDIRVWNIGGLEKSKGLDRLQQLFEPERGEL